VPFGAAECQCPSDDFAFDIFLARLRSFQTIGDGPHKALT
jgi:hypothetical protein